MEVRHMNKVRIYIDLITINKETEIFISDNYLLDDAIKDIYRLLNEKFSENIKVYYEDYNNLLDITKCIKDIGIKDGDKLIVVS